MGGLKQQPGSIGGPVDGQDRFVAGGRKQIAALVRARVPEEGPQVAGWNLPCVNLELLAIPTGLKDPAGGIFRRYAGAGKPLAAEALAPRRDDL